LLAGGALSGSMLILARFAAVSLLGGGLLSPRNEGPLIDGVSSGGGTGALRTVSAGARDGTASDRVDDVEPTPTACGLFVEGAGASRVVPHIPQKRFSSGFSLPQRGQRTDSPDSLYSLRYLGDSM
jgi:hypothetical protein